MTSVLWTFFASAVIILGLTVYAVRTSADFTDMGGSAPDPGIGLASSFCLSDRKEPLSERFEA